MATNPTADILVPYPQADRPQLKLTIGPCRLRLGPGAQDQFVSGRYEDPTALLPVQVVQGPQQVSISQATQLRSVGRLTQPPSLDLRLGTKVPFELTVEGGANDTALDLGGLPVARLTIHQGAGRSTVDFGSPNPAEMAAFDVASGGVAMDLRGLANANFEQMTVSGGAASYRLEFGGQLRRDADVRLNTGVSAVELIVPATTPARISSSSIVGGLDVGDGFLTREGAFWNEAAARGDAPVLRITVTSMFGAVRLRTAAPAG